MATELPLHLGPPVETLPVPALDPASTQSTKPSVEPVKDEVHPAQPTEEEPTQPLNPDKSETNSLLDDIALLTDTQKGLEPKLDDGSAAGPSSNGPPPPRRAWSFGTDRRDRARGEVASVPPPGDKPEDIPPPRVSQINRVPWAAFQRNRHSSPFAIDVLVGDPDPKVAILTRFSQFNVPAPARQVAEAADEAEAAEAAEAAEGAWAEDDLDDLDDHDHIPIKKASTFVAMPPSHTQRTKVRSQAPLPERIRINSPAIIELLNNIVDMEDEDKAETDAPLLMMQPFRALVYHKDEIRNAKKRLEAEIKDKDKNMARAKALLQTGLSGGEKKKDGDDTSRDGDNAKLKIYGGSEPESGAAFKDDGPSYIGPLLNSQRDVDDIQCLVDFIDTELGGRLAYLAGDDCQRVTFSDIWHLFKPGDCVLGADTKQAYRVLNVEYSKHSMKLPSPRDVWRHGAKARLEDSPITIQCIYIDFDGEQIGPVLKTFEFHRFEGDRSVRSLDIVPLRLAKTDGELEKTLIKRGSTFIDACGTGRRGVPLHYSGLTLDTKEEVNSQVVIDFEEAFAANGGNRRNEKGGLTTEQVVLELFVSMLREEAPKGQNPVFVPDAMAQNWKPTIENIDTRYQDEIKKKDEEATKKARRSEYATDSDSDRSRGSITRQRRKLNKKHSRNRQCIPECCGTENVHDDTYVERGRTTDFIQGQFREQRETGSRQRVPSLAISPQPLGRATEDEHFITDGERLIVTYRVFGFIMRSRKWAQLDLTHLGPPKGENTFDLLVLPPGHRNMVESLVTQHYLDKASALDETDERDIVHGKGKGLILLLHGAPGVGKTTTAECVATYFHKPLFQITCGDLGATAEVVERRLETNFALASRWGCILLIDEADVFLEARQTENFDRNSLVAVFLRTLEYYTGILFLTTNRVGTFDEAFTSRIHISLYYPPLDQASTLAVFEVNLNRIKERFHKKEERGVAKLLLHERSIKAFVLNYYSRNKEARWNGRQIRNACQTALALAEFEAHKKVAKATNSAAGGGGAGIGRTVMDVAATSRTMVTVKMSAKHFGDVAEAYLAFMRYLRDVHGVSAAQQAKNFRLRHDHYGLGREPPTTAGGLGLLASRQRPQQTQTQRAPPVQKRKTTTTTTTQVEVEVVEEEEEVLGEYGYGEAEFYEEEQDDDEDALLDEEEEALEEEVDEEDAEEDLDDDANFGALDDEQLGEVEEFLEEEFQEEGEYSYEAPPKARPQAAGGGRVLTPRSRGQSRVAAPAGNPRGGGVGRGKAVATAAATAPAGRPLGKPPRGGLAPPAGQGRGKAPAGAAAAGRGRGRRVVPRQE
ncbi:hypothetical protein B0T24DRAFT_530547 [Lasiosphaeria ovina]|uniref:AAA+ ATPase domain-containing protein n=1 Tax=Lasiosphaeria ovina TaxID=92902 RepID=A0AAE0K6W0_9PEZI|nr:hypothetical protein B0T24DRAFT_530547 [Lasiosphaeria ovina]